MAEPGQHLGLAVEAFDEGRFLPQLVREDLSRDESVELRLAGFIGRTHAAGTDQPDDLQLREMRGNFRDGQRD